MLNIFRRSSHKGHIIIQLVRILFVCLLFFEFLNFIGLLHVKLQFTWLGLLITGSVSWILLETIGSYYLRKKKHPLHWVIWMVVLAGVSLDAAGDIFQFYSNFHWWDRLVHFSMNVVVALLLFVITNAFWIDANRFSLLVKRERLELSLLLAAGGAAILGSLYEVEEYFEDFFFHTNRLGPGTDTANDLFFNFLGIAFAVGIILLHFFKTHKRQVLE